ncbi:conserved hypothetical protein [Hyella patelloides LEGE 07179]|uniref:Sulfotransferase domain-containing protein n=1 Tax=Hyella patelloides LEGE 07179 TaxID=945734 RepID=A0A563VLE6_9CYAN|nr:sulfotransferase domain-containing protein [Hyella patelloides]VEP12238.1 conserved hypothetical protein [Hyella patelloides LEGE 07179]
MTAITRKIHQFNQQLQTQLWTKYYIDYDLSSENTILLAGCGRSGTTWVSNIINYQNKYRYIFEPFCLEEVDVFKSLDFGNGKYLRHDAEDKELLKVVKFICSGKLRNKWCDRFNQKFITDRRLIKVIRINLLLGWINHKLPSMPIILLLRHPCAVANSKIQLNWKTSINKYLIQEQLIQDFLHPFIDTIKAINNQGDAFEKIILAWCIENYVPLKQFEKKKLCIVFYEKLCTEPELELKKIFSFLGDKDNKYLTHNFRIPSQLSRRSSSIITGENLTDSWKKNITERQIKKAMEILSIFGLEQIYSHNSIPESQNLKILMAS